MNILIITPYIPFPLSEGGKISQYAEIDSIRKTNLITLTLTARSKTDIENIQTLRNHWSDVEIKTIDLIHKENEVKPEHGILKTILKNAREIKNHSIRFIKHFLKVKQNKNADAQILDKKEEEHDEFDLPYLKKLPEIKSRQFIDQLTEIIKEKKYDIIQVEHYDYMDLVFLFPQEIKKIFVHHEIRYARLKSFALSSGEESDEYEEYVMSAIKSSEINILKNYDAIFVFSGDDKKKLKHELPDSQIFVVPFPVLDSYFQDISKEKLKIEKLVFVGGEKHSPNKDAVQWYINSIAPVVKAQQDLCLHVIGNWSPKFIAKYENSKSVFFPGYVEDIITYCKNSIMLVPVRIGSGIRTKILYAMAQGVPVISTKIGCEGINVNGNDIFIADNELKFAEVIDRIIKNTDLTNQMLLNSQQIIYSSYSQKVTGELRNKIFSQIMDSKTL